MHVGAQEIALRRLVSPQLPFQLRSRHDARHVLHQQHQYAASRGRELEELTATMRFEGVEIEAQVRERQDARRLRNARASHQRLETDVELREREGLDEIVVRTGFESLDLVFEQIFRGE